MEEDFINSKAKELFNIDYVFPFQRLVIANTLRAAGFYGDDEKNESIPRQIVLLPTGAGKSLCFMLPGLILNGITLIIFPLLSLMSDQERRIIEAGGTVVTLKGGMSHKEKLLATELIEKGRVKFILINPETLKTEWVLKLLQSATITHAVIDETHTVSQWGESFRPTYLEVGKHIKSIGVNLVTAYTATASSYIIESVKKYIFLGDSVNIVKGNPDRVNIHYSVVPTINKEETLLHILQNAQKPLIIFHSSRTSCEVTNTLLINRTGNKEIVYYHAGLKKEEKQEIEKWFFTSDSGILNATCAYGMGVDKQNIRTVIHLEPPNSIEAYLQESGRGGRDRNQAKAILIINKNSIANSKFATLLNNNCRRVEYLKMLGADVEYCSGCDICDGTYNSYELGKEQIIQFVGANSGQFNIEESARILKGFYSYNAISNQYHNYKGFGLLSGWDLDYIKIALKNVIKDGSITLKKRVFLQPKLYKK